MDANPPFEGPILSKLGPSAFRMRRIWIRAGAASSGRLRSWRVLAANARHGLPQHDPEKWTSVFQPKDELSFASLVDAGGNVGHAFGLRWKVSDELRAVEEGCGVDLTAFNGDPSWTLTMPARYVVAPDGMIEYADISVDYTRRGDPSELIPVLAHLAAH